GDTATMTGSTGDDQFYGLPAYSVMKSATSNPNTYWNEAIGFGVVNATASTGMDIASLYDSAGNDTFTADNNGSKLVAGGATIQAAAFDVVYGLLLNGGSDVVNLQPKSGATNYIFGTAATSAHLFDTGGGDIFYAVPRFGYSFMQGSGFIDEVINIGNVQ